MADANAPEAQARGEVSAQMAVISSLLFGLVFLIVGLGSWWTSAQTAALAADHAAVAAASGDMVAGLNAAEQTVHDLGGHLANAPRVTRAGHTVFVEVSVSVGSPAGILPEYVTRSRRVSLEEFVDEAGR